MKYVSKADAHPAASTPVAYLNGKLGTMDGENLQAPKIRRNTKLLMEAGVIPAAEI